MGHYDEEYAAEERDREVVRRAKLLSTLAEIDRAVEILKRVGWTGIVTKELKDAIAKVDDEFILWQHQNNLLVPDPQILIDVLKDEV